MMGELVEAEYKKKESKPTAFAHGNYYNISRAGYPVETIVFPVQFFKSYELK